MPSPPYRKTQFLVTFLAAINIGWANITQANGTTSGTFTSSITGLTAGTVYYVRAYATNAIGTSYGAAQSFTTLSTSSNNPVLASTTTATSITANSAMLGGDVTDEGATEVSVRGLVYGTSTGASTFSVTLGSGAGTFTSTLTGLAQGTTYFVRSFATNVQGTSYGAETSFTTQTTPTVSVTATPTSLTGNVAGLNLYVDPENGGDGDGTILIVNPDAYTWYESPTYRLRAESTAAGQVTIGYYGFGAIATKVGAGAFKNNKA